MVEDALEVVEVDVSGPRPPSADDLRVLVEINREVD